MAAESRFLRKIARLYYTEELTLREIGERLNVSAATVSRSLARAKELGIVRISISEDEEDYTDIEVALAQRYGLTECLLSRSAERREVVYTDLAEPLSEFLSRALPPSGLLGVSWGLTLKSVAGHMHDARGRGVDVVPIIGAMGMIETGIYPNGIAQAFAGALGGDSYLVNAPAVLDSEETAAGVRRDSTFLPILRLWERLDVVLLGASGLGSDTSLVQGGIFDEEEVAAMERAGGVCAVNFVVLDSDGAIVDHPIARRIINLPVELLRRVPQVVVVAAGPDKIEPTRVALKSGLTNVLVSDVATARALL